MGSEVKGREQSQEAKEHCCSLVLASTFLPLFKRKKV
jgi:hypothetical protein